MAQITFDVPGKPQGKGRPRASVMGGHARLRTPQETVQYENWIKLCYQRTANNTRFAAPVILEVLALFEVPQSYPKKKAMLCTQNITRPTCKPDMDNIVKAVADALNGVAYKDDSGIVETHVYKRYGPQAMLRVKLTGELIPTTETLDERSAGNGL